MSEQRLDITVSKVKKRYTGSHVDYLFNIRQREDISIFDNWFDNKEGDITLTLINNHFEME
uniref:Uncharacterized protein n=1 Tax=viral metagenome TaxID=1070528 RepID=A0A6M3JND0_9ZZZZ